MWWLAATPAALLRRQNERMSVPPFAELAATPEATIDLLALALAVEFRRADVSGAIAALDLLGAELSEAARQTRGTPDQQALACAQVLGVAHGFTGNRRDYYHPDNSMLDLVLSRRRGLPILLSVVYIEVARRAAIPLAGVGLPGHFVVGHFGADPPLLLDPFSGGLALDAHAPESLVRAWGAHEIAMRMLHNLVAAYQRRGDLGAAIRAAAMRLELPSEEPLRDSLEAELRGLQARLN